MANALRRLDVSNATLDQKREILKYATDVRKFEIERFWQRSLFFWGFIGVAFVGYTQLLNRGNLALVVACFGLVCSMAWTLQNRGSKYWQEAWEFKVQAVEFDVLGADLFANREPLKQKGVWGARRFSVSKLAITLSDFTVLIWLVLAFNAIQLTMAAAMGKFAVIATVVTILYVALLFTCRQSKADADPRHKAKAHSRN
jgi:hypothetical protein